MNPKLKLLPNSPRPMSAISHSNHRPHPTAPASNPAPTIASKLPRSAADNLDTDRSQRRSYAKSANGPSNERVAKDTTADAIGERSGQVAQQLIEEFDKSQVLLVQVKMPVSMDKMSRTLRDIVPGVAGSSEPETMTVTPIAGGTEQYYRYPDGTVRTNGIAEGRQAFPPVGVIVVEGTADQIRTSLTNLVSQPQVQIVSTNASPTQLHSLGLKLESLAGGKQGAPNLGATLGGSLGGLGPPTAPGAAKSFGMGSGGSPSPAGMIQGGYPGMGRQGYGGGSGSGGFPGTKGQEEANPVPRLMGNSGYPGMGDTTRNRGDQPSAGTGGDRAASADEAVRIESRKGGRVESQAGDGLVAGAKPTQPAAESAASASSRQPQGQVNSAVSPSGPAGKNGSEPKGTTAPSPPPSDKPASGEKSRPATFGAPSGNGQAAAQTELQTVVTYLFRLKPKAQPADAAAPAQTKPEPAKPAK